MEQAALKLTCCLFPFTLVWRMTGSSAGGKKATLPVLNICEVKYTYWKNLAQNMLHASEEVQD